MSTNRLWNPAEYYRPVLARLLDWSRIERHLREAGALRGGIYRLLRDLLPATVLALCWIAEHRPTFSWTKDYWLAPHVSLLELALLAGVTLIARAVTAHGPGRALPVLHSELAAGLLSSFLASCLVYPALLPLMSSSHALRIDLYYFLACAAATSMLLGLNCLFRYLSFDTVFGRRDVLLIGSGRAAIKVFNELSDSPVYRIVGILDDQFHGTNRQLPHYIGPLQRLESVLKETPTSIVYCSLPVRSMYEQIQRVIETCERFGVEVRHSSRIFQTSIAQFDPAPQASYSILRMVRHDWTLAVKRGMDILGAGLLLVCASPLLAAIAVAIKITSPGPVLFAQERYGFHRCRFRMLKFRSMVVNAERLQSELEDQNELDGPIFKIRNDPRISGIGAFLRRTSLDELPQLWNVLIGDMSLVGPRPLAVRDVQLIRDSSQLRRFSVMPGITCIWQISGRNNSDFDTWIRQDLEYIDRWSLWLDVKILFGTIPAVLGGRGAM